MLLADSGNLAVMTLLELSAAFDSVDHTTLLRQLQTSYGLCGTVLNWFTSYLTGRMQYVPTMASSSASCADRSSMFCTPPTCCLWYKVTAWHHTPMSMIHNLQRRISCNCSDDGSACIVIKRLQLDQNDTEVFWWSSVHRQYQIPASSVQLGSTSVQPVLTVRNLGVRLEHIELLTCIFTVICTTNIWTFYCLRFQSLGGLSQRETTPYDFTV